jgi:hypothetical protein
LFACLGAIVAGVVLRVISEKRAQGFVTQTECQARHASDCQMSTQLIAKIDDLRVGQEKFQATLSAKNGHLFRMMRSIVVYMDISQEQKERILNERPSE